MPLVGSGCCHSSGSLARLYEHRVPPGAPQGRVPGLTNAAQRELCLLTLHTRQQHTQHTAVRWTTGPTLPSRPLPLGTEEKLDVWQQTQRFDSRLRAEGRRCSLSGAT